MEYLDTLGKLALTNFPNIVGFMMPPLVELLNKDVHSSGEKRIVALLACFAVAVGLHWNEIAYGTPELAIASFVIIFAESQTVFKIYFNDSWLRGTIQEKIGKVQLEESLG